MRKTIIIIVAGLLVSVASVASAGPPHGDGGHIHHVHTPSGCVQLDQVTWYAEDRGLHEGASSSGFEQGVWHGPCH